jgi:hypothetical protein
MDRRPDGVGALTYSQDPVFEDAVLVFGVQIAWEKVDQHINVFCGAVHNREQVHGMRLILLESHATISVPKGEAILQSRIDSPAAMVPLIEGANQPKSAAILA